MPKTKAVRTGFCTTRFLKNSCDLNWTFEEFSKIQNGVGIMSNTYHPFSSCTLYATIEKYIPENSANPRKMMSIKIFPSGSCTDLTLSVKAYDKNGTEICNPRVDVFQTSFWCKNKFCICLSSDNSSYDLENIEGDVVSFVFSTSYKMILTKSYDAPYHRTPYNNSLNTLSKDFKKLYDSSLGTDIVFVVKGVYFPVHKPILIFRSEYFKSMFASNMTEANANEVEINDIEPDIFKYVLEYLYTGCLPDITFSKACGLYSVANMYCLSELRRICKNKLLTQLSVDNAHELLCLADLQNDKDMLKQIVEFIDFNKLDIEMTDYIRKTLAREVSSAELRDLIKSVLLKTV